MLSLRRSLASTRRQVRASSQMSFSGLRDSASGEGLVDRGYAQAVWTVSGASVGFDGSNPFIYGPPCGLNINASSSYAETDWTADIAPRTDQPFCIELSVSGATSRAGKSYASVTVADSGPYVFMFYTGSTGGLNVFFFFRDAGGTDRTLDSGIASSADMQMALSWDGAVWRTFVNGASGATLSSAQGLGFTAGRKLRLGNYQLPPNNAAAVCYLDMFRVTRGWPVRVSSNYPRPGRF